MGASVTACGRQITTFMIKSIGELVTGNQTNVIKQSHIDKDGKIAHVYTTDSDVILLSDTDSVEAKSLIKTNLGEKTIEKLFDLGRTVVDERGREFSFVDGLTSFTSDGQKMFEKPVKMIYRHRVKKPKWKITLENGKSVIVTNDHSIMVLRDNKLIEIKPSDINADTDTCVSISE